MARAVTSKTVNMGPNFSFPRVKKSSACAMGNKRICPGNKKLIAPHIPNLAKYLKWYV
jgi:hypothetical protein